MVLDVRVGDVDGVDGEEGDGVDLEEGGDLRDLEVGVKGVAEEGGAGVGVRTWLYRRLGDHRTEEEQGNCDEEGNEEKRGGIMGWHLLLLLLLRLILGFGVVGAGSEQEEE